MSHKNARHLEKKVLENTDRLIECAIAASLLGNDAKDKELRRGVSLISEIVVDLQELIEVKDEYLPEILSQIISQKLPDIKIQQSLGTFTEELERMLRLGTINLAQPFEGNFSGMWQNLPEQTGAEAEAATGANPPVAGQSVEERAEEAPVEKTVIEQAPIEEAQNHETPIEDGPVEISDLAQAFEPEPETVSNAAEGPLEDASEHAWDESVRPESGILLSDLLGAQQETDQAANQAPEAETAALSSYELPLKDEIILDPWSKEEQHESPADLNPAVQEPDNEVFGREGAAGQAAVLDLEQRVQALTVEAQAEAAEKEGPVRQTAGEPAAAAPTADNSSLGEEPEMLHDFQALDGEESGEAKAAMAPLPARQVEKPVRGLELSLKLVFPGQEILREVTLNGIHVSFYLPGRNLAIDPAVSEEEYRLKQRICRQEGWEYFAIDEEDSKNPRRLERILRRTRKAVRV